MVVENDEKRKKLGVSKYRKGEIFGVIIYIEESMNVDELKGKSELKSSNNKKKNGLKMILILVTEGQFLVALRGQKTENCFG